MSGSYTAEVAELGLQELWLTPLTQAQEAFEAVQNQRITNGAAEVASMTKFRPALVNALRTFVQSLEVYADYTRDKDISTYAAEVDELIGQTMPRLKAAINRSSNTTPPVTAANSSPTAG